MPCVNTRYCTLFEMCYIQQSQGGDVTVEKKGRGLKRRPTAKNMKKAWAENYKDSVEELTTRDILPGSRGEGTYCLITWEHDLVSTFKSKANKLTYKCISHSSDDSSDIDS